MCKLKRVCEHQAINLETHRDRRCQRRHNERYGNDEPCNNTEVETTEEVEDKDGRSAKYELECDGDEGEISYIKAKLDGEEEGIQKSRGAKIIYEFHFRPLCSIHKK